MSSKRILIVEDDALSMDLMIHMVKKYGEPIMALNGKEALEIFENSIKENKPIDIILLDIMMPIANGKDVLSHIRNLEHQKGIHGLERVPIIMTTALQDYESVANSFNNQADGYLVKPISSEMIENIFKEHNLV